MDADYTGDMDLELDSAVAREGLLEGNLSSSPLACLTNSERLDLVGVMTYLATSTPDGHWPNVSSNCSLPAGVHSLADLHTAPDDRPMTFIVGRLFYAWFTPLVFLVGVVGNSLSLCVFLSRNMRSLSASTYLAALSTADLTALVFYVLVEWLIRGLPALLHGPGGPPGGDGGEEGRGAGVMMAVQGTCQMVMYLHYVSRFLSAWLVVAFTVERYIGVCHPLRRRDICTISTTRRLVLGLVIASFLLNVFKPLLSQVQHIPGWGSMCTAHPNHRRLSFVLDSLYAVMITFVPFVVITIFNLLIIRKLLRHNRTRKQVRVVTEESVIRLEFTLILLAVSFCFVALNVPYFSTWLQLFLTSRYVSFSSFSRPTDLDYFRGVAFVTRAIFYVNYCINFFLYSITGAYFRRELRMLFVLRQQKYKYGSTYTRCTRLVSSHSRHSLARQCSQMSSLSGARHSSDQGSPLQGCPQQQGSEQGSQPGCRQSNRALPHSWVLGTAIVMPWRFKSPSAPPVPPNFPFLGRPVSLSNS
ncbi:cysteinyl leukotriene receptor 2-like [Babylonia areolata]|uniref:cysteinyl leukotriene receptor 2-like n=1 Tax=Babylonia areolata TaxID=304850 RepID=UPI003FD3B449